VGRSAASNQGVLDIASVEVLRGPQGTLFGKNTVAGAINITTIKPQAGYSGYLEGGIGNYADRQIRGVANLGFAENVGLRLSGSYAKRDGFTRNLSNGLDYDNRDDYSLRAQFQVKSGDTTFYLAGDTAVLKSRSTAGGERLPDPLAPNPREISIDRPQDFYIRYSGISGEIDHEFSGGGTLTAITGYRTGRTTGSADEDYSPANVAATTDATEETRHFSQELRYASPTGGSFDYLIGLYYLDQRVVGSSAATVFAKALNPSAPAVFVGANHNAVVKTQTYAAFLHANYRFTDALELTVGARLTHEKKSLDYAIADTSTLFTNGTLKDKRTATDFSPTVSLNYKFSDDVMGYVRYARGFKAGGWNTDFVRSLPDMDFGDESVNAYEAGLKSELFDRRLRLNLAAYVSKHKNYQVFSFVTLANGGTAINVSNAGKLTSKGFEVEVEANPIRWLTLFANYGYNDAKFDSFVNGGGPGVNFDGNRPAEAPRHNLNLGASANFEVGSARLTIQGDYNYRSAPLEQVNLRGGVEMGNFSVFGWVRNLFDATKTIYNSRSFLGIPRVEFNDPRTYGITVKVRFGS